MVGWNRTNIILVSILSVGLLICGYFLFRNNDYIRFLKKEGDQYKIDNKILEDKIAIQDELIITYEHQFDSIRR